MTQSSGWLPFAAARCCSGRPLAGRVGDFARSRGRAAAAREAAVLGRPLRRGVQRVRAGQRARRPAHQARGADRQREVRAASRRFFARICRRRSCSREARPRTPNRWRTYADALWAVGLFRGRRREVRGGAGDPARQRPRPARSGPQSRRAQQAGRRANTAQAALNRDPRDAEFHHTVGSIYERMQRYEEAANAYSSYINLLPNKDRSAKAAWARAEVRFLRAFGTQASAATSTPARPASCTRCRSAC